MDGHEVPGIYIYWGLDLHEPGGRQVRKTGWEQASGIFWCWRGSCFLIFKKNPADVDMSTFWVPQTVGFLSLIGSRVMALLYRGSLQAEIQHHLQWQSRFGATAIWSTTASHPGPIWHVRSAAPGEVFLMSNATRNQQPEPSPLFPMTFAQRLTSSNEDLECVAKAGGKKQQQKLQNQPPPPQKKHHNQIFSKHHYLFHELFIDIGSAGKYDSWLLWQPWTGCWRGPNLYDEICADGLPVCWSTGLLESQVERGKSQAECSGRLDSWQKETSNIGDPSWEGSISTSKVWHPHLFGTQPELLPGERCFLCGCVYSMHRICILTRCIDCAQTVGSAVNDFANNSGPQDHRDQLAASETIPIQAWHIHHILLCIPALGHGLLCLDGSDCLDPREVGWASWAERNRGGASTMDIFFSGNDFCMWL